ncbi:arylamine N-acetyltransferase [Microbulbifer sp. SAOS-129_SWC]|uniref:arylamine N-acetyltransferase family protein n=1 Tax=Microbulbifer sp. SAOS-129_SWC TaxID=3145235 RepID=UPI003216A536
MNTNTFDLDAYLQRIGFRGRPAVNLETLTALISHHTRTIPFENLNPFLGWPVETELAAVAHKLVNSRRGGYCFEQNALLRAALLAIGFSADGLAARVLWQQPAGHQAAQSHMILRVTLEQTAYLVDVGFGGHTPTAPLRMDEPRAQATPQGSYRIRPIEGEFLLESKASQAAGDHDWQPVYRFNLHKQSAGDYKVFNWYCSTHPESRFVNHLVAARAFSGGRHTLFDRTLSYHPVQGPKTTLLLAGPRELRDALSSVFDIQLPADAAVERGLQRLFVAPARQA